MFIKLKEFQDICKTILFSVSNESLNTISDLVELFAENGKLTIATTNKEYYVKASTNIEDTGVLHATVPADQFLKLIEKQEVDILELTVDSNCLNIKGSGNYSIPLIYDNEEMVSLPVIDIDNPEVEFDITTEILNSIYKYNSTQLSLGVISTPVDRMYYIDEQGCITKTEGACVNKFTLDKKVRMLIKDNIAKLFKLFKSDKVHFYLGHTFDITPQTRVRFENDDVTLTAILNCTEAMLDSVPAELIRNMANNAYNFTATFDNHKLLNALDRLKLFTSKNSLSAPDFEFTDTGVNIIIDNNIEEVKYATNSDNISYRCKLDINEVYDILAKALNKSHVTMNFGNEAAVTFSTGEVIYVVPECME